VSGLTIFAVLRVGESESMFKEGFKDGVDTVDERFVEM
jgi:hypothetical protein